MVAQKLFAKTVRTFRALIYLTVILVSFGTVPELAFAAEAPQPFAAFEADVDIDIEDGELELMTKFKLGPGSNGIDPTKEPVSLQVKGGSGAYSLTIPPGSFKKDRSGFSFQGTVDRVRLRASIRTVRDGAFEFELENERANFKGFANPVTVSLVIGDGGGSQTVKAKIE
jgi:hypothetical protein